MTPRARRRLRWLVPALVVAGTAAAAALPSVLPAGADPVPVLPALTPAQLLQKVRTAHVDSLSGDVTLATNLGLPDLGALDVGGGSALDLMSGTHTAHVWYDGPERVRLALDSPQAETDWIRNGTDVWMWDSSSQAVKHATLDESTDGPDPAKTAPDGVPAVDPIAAADELLAAVDPTTEVTVRTPGYVAGRPVYELVVTPRSAASTIADGVVSVDAATGLPLAVRIDAKGSTSPAVAVSFTSISFDRPAASVFTFTPPPGARVSEATSPTDLLPLGSFGRTERVDRRPVGAEPGTPTPAGPTRRAAAPAAAATADASHVKIVGTAWDSVAIVSGVNIGRQLQALFASSAVVTVGSTTGHLVTTRLVNVLVLDDGRIALGAVTTDALVAAAATA